MLDLSGKWVLVTGAARGIGRLISLAMAGQGCHLLLHSRSLAHTRELEEQLRAMGVQALSFEADLARPDSVEAMLAAIDETQIPVEVVFNNAGLQIGYRTDYLNTPIEDYPVSFQINTIAPMQICYHFLPQMLARGFGRIVNTTSGIALEAEQGGYSASKAALSKVTVDLSYKLRGTDVILSLTDPGWCRTDLGGPHAPNAPESTIPGVIVGAFVDDGTQGRLFEAQNFAGLPLAEAVERAALIPSPWD